MRRRALALILILSPCLARGGVSYDVSSWTSALSPEISPYISHYQVQDGNVRMADDRTKLVTIFRKDWKRISVDSTAGISVVQTNATNQWLVKHYEADAYLSRMVPALQEPPFIAAALTGRSERVFGLACRVWKLAEYNGNALEICVAPSSSVPGGNEILGGLETLSAFHDTALYGIGIGLRPLQDWWTTLKRLDGVPIRFREFRGALVVSEMTLFDVREEKVCPGAFEAPMEYKVRTLDQ